MVCQHFEVVGKKVTSQKGDSASFLNADAYTKYSSVGKPDRGKLKRKVETFKPL